MIETATGIAFAAGTAAAKGTTSSLVKTFIEKVVTPYFSGRAAKVEMVKRLKAYLRWLDQRTKHIPTIAIQGGVFNLEEIYEPLQICSVEGNNCIEISGYPSSAFDSNRCIAIVDSAGMGKSTLTKFILRSSLNGLKKIPILVELRRLKPGAGILDLVCTDILNTDSKSAAAGHLTSAIKDGNFIFFFDGYDEIQDDVKSKVSQEIVRLTSEFHLCNFMLTSRKEVALSGLPEFYWYHISKLTPEKSLSLLRRYDRNKGVADRLWSKASGIEEISDFLQTPLLLTLLYKAFDYKSVIPLKKVTFFRQVFDALYQDHDLSKEGFFERRKKSSLDLEDFHKVMRRVGLESVRRGEVQFAPEEFHELISRSIKDAGLEADPSKFKSDLVSAVPLFVKDGIDYRWSHKSFADYFAGQCVWLDLGRDRDTVVASMLSSERCEKYTAALQIMCELDQSLVLDGYAYEMIRSMLDSLDPDFGPNEYYLAVANYVARVFLVPGEYSMERAEVFDEVHEEVSEKFCLNGYKPWRITWLEGAILFVERNKNYSQVSVVCELIGASSPRRRDRLNKDFYGRFESIVLLNDYILSAETEEDRSQALAFIRSGLGDIRLPQLSVMKDFLRESEKRRAAPVAAVGAW